MGLFTSAPGGQSGSAQGWAVRALQGNPAQAVGRPCSAFPPLDNRHLLRRTERSCCKEILEGSARCRDISYALHSSLGFFWFKLSIQLISYFFIVSFLCLFSFFSLFPLVMLEKYQRNTHFRQSLPPCPSSLTPSALS